MTCPVCGGDTSVTSCRKDNEAVYRKRKCLRCDHKFYTTELESGSEDFLRLEAEAKRESRERKNGRVGHDVSSLRR